MAYRIFSYPIPAPSDPEDLNAFLATNRIASTMHHLVESPTGPMLVFVVQTVPGKPEPITPRARIDYKTVLSPEDFEVFSRLRDIRKTMAEEKGVPAYAILTNAQLAEMVTGRVTSLDAMKSIEGIGTAKASDFGESFLKALVPAPKAST